MTYTINIPLATDDPSVSQGQLFNNFNVINTANSVNHVAFNATGQGKHKFVEMPNRGTIAIPVLPSPLTGGEGTLYTSADASSVSQLMYTPDTSGTTGPITNLYQMTRAIPGSWATFGTNPGWTFLPGGLLMMWGTTAQSSSGSARVINFAALGLPNFTNPPFSIQLTSQRTTSDPGSSFEFYVDNTTVATTGFSFYNRSNHTYGYYWVAIGV
jgi:hypothetical protein